MHRSIAIAYTVAAAATAIALVVVVGATEGFHDEADEARAFAESAEHASLVPAPAPLDPNAANLAAASSEPVIVYEDAPAGRYEDDHERHEREEHEDEEEDGEHEDHEARERRAGSDRERSERDDD